MGGRIGHLSWRKVLTTTDLAFLRLDRFVVEQKTKLSLRKNISKGDWRDHSLREALGHLKDEVQELDDDITTYLRGPGSKRDPGREAIDVANTAMMVWDRFNRGDDLD